jgi:hypothetical protein
VRAKLTLEQAQLVATAERAWRKLRLTLSGWPGQRMAGAAKGEGEEQRCEGDKRARLVPNGARPGRGPDPLISAHDGRTASVLPTDATAQVSCVSLARRVTGTGAKFRSVRREGAVGEGGRSLW